MKKPGAAGIVFYDDAVARGFEPFALTRPISTLTTGIWPILTRWGLGSTQQPAVIAAEHLADFDEDVSGAGDVIAAGTVVANSRFAPRAGDDSASRDGALAWRADGRVAAVTLARDVPRSEFADGALTLESLVTDRHESVDVAGWWHDEVWDFLRLLPVIMAADIEGVAAAPEVKALAGKSWGPPSHSIVLGGHPVIVHCGEAGSGVKPATIEPSVVFDASAGPILVDAGAHIHSFTRITGPCYIGRGATILGSDISGCSIGPVAKVRGEISGTVILGYSNKGHEGFVGNSYLGRWVNLGAGTTTSNLKNTYGPVALWTPTGIRATGMQFLGTMFGDHVKTGIGTMLTTGTVLGAGANVFGTSMPPKVVAPFSWGEGEPYDLYQIDKFLATAATVMGRRKVELTEGTKRQLAASFEKRWSVR